PFVLLSNEGEDDRADEPGVEEHRRGGQDPEERPGAALDRPPPLRKDQEAVKLEVPRRQTVSAADGNAQEQFVEQAGEEERPQCRRDGAPSAGDRGENETPPPPGERP